jgi:ATP-dependent RNA helicase DHX29
MPPLLASPPIANSADEAPLSKSLIPDLAATPSSAPTAQTESPDIDDPHAEYVRLRLEIDSLTSRRGAKETRDASQLATLKQNLVKAQNHYFFRADEAEVLYRTARKAADAQALQTHLRADGGSHDTPTPPAKRRPPKLKEPVPPISVALSDATDSDGREGGMLGILETPYEVKTSDGKIIPIRDMGAPKQWSNRTPKLLLAETVHKVDRYAVITYSNVSGHSRARRSSVSIRGKGGKSGTWTMNEIACSNDEQVCELFDLVPYSALTHTRPNNTYLLSHCMP